MCPAVLIRRLSRSILAGRGHPSPKWGAGGTTFPAPRTRGEGRRCLAEMLHIGPASPLLTDVHQGLSVLTIGREGTRGVHPGPHLPLLWAHQRPLVPTCHAQEHRRERSHHRARDEEHWGQPAVQPPEGINHRRLVQPW